MVVYHRNARETNSIRQSRLSDSLTPGWRSVSSSYGTVSERRNNITTASRYRVNHQVPMAEEENPATCNRLLAFLEEHDVKFTLSTHEVCRTSEESAAVRGATLDSGAKTLLIKDCTNNLVEQGVPFFLVVMSASRRFSSKQFKKIIGARKIRFASPDELQNVTGCLPGAVPPFGSLFGIPSWVDRSLTKQETINFNCGLRTASVRMQYADYQMIEHPNTHVFTIEEMELGEAPETK